MAALRVPIVNGIRLRGNGNEQKGLVEAGYDDGLIRGVHDM